MELATISYRIAKYGLYFVKSFGFEKKSIAAFKTLVLLDVTKIFSMKNFRQSEDH